ncbi:MAG: hypothetical protein LBK41_02895 [Clostridiales bacterium]|jgi:hypothetical protein|nr:hypothetical protein [Clostridiales bacterium]
MNDCVFPLKNAPANYFIGKKPAAVVFGGETITVKKWTDVYRLIYERVNQNPQSHEDLMYLRNKVSGKVRLFISDKPDGMRRPMKVDEEIYVEMQYGTETMFHIMVGCILKYVRYDLSDIKIIVKY